MEVAADSQAESRKQFMRIALQMAERGMAAGGPPVGACLVRDDQVIASAHNAVIGELDITAHAEICLLREACRAERALQLEGTTLYVTVEPCAMCLAACFYAGVSEIIFGAPIELMQTKTGAELCTDAAQLYAGAEQAPQVSGGVLTEECSDLLQAWQPRGGHR